MHIMMGSARGWIKGWVKASVVGLRASHRCRDVSRILLLLLAVQGFMLPLKTSEAGAFMPVLMVIDISGQVSKTGANPATIALLDQLQAGDEIKLERAAYVVLVYLKSGLEIRVDASRVDDSGLVRIGHKGVIVSQGARQQSKQIHYKSMAGERVHIDPVQTQIAGIVMRAEARPSVELDNLQDTLMMQSHPLFRWHSTLAASRYHFKLNNAQDEMLYEKNTRALSLQLPDNIRLKPGQSYIWYVKAQFADGMIDSDWGKFRLLSSARQNQVRQRKPAPEASFSEQVLYAVWLEQYKLFDAALQQWADLAALRPKNKVLQSMKLP
ncbi:MAG: hypothetical protein Q9M16_01475 [Mariprofundus sp.]|nr:hypothetical protein [Mariprofundus sp.]